MVRATILSIVLILVAAPNATVLCKAWCDPTAAAAAGHHMDRSPSATLAGIDDCGMAAPGSAVVVNAGARRNPPSADPQPAVIAPRHQRAIFSSEAHPGDHPGCRWFLAQRPRVTALRI